MDPTTGRMLNADMEFYRLAGLGDIPELVVHMMTGKGYDEHGVIGLGEPPVISPGAAIATAVANAIGVTPPFLPLTSDRVLNAFVAAGGCMMRAFSLYVSPATKVEAVHVLDSLWGITEVIGCGSDLLALMKTRVVTPEVRVNIKNIPELCGVTMTKNALRVGALTQAGRSGRGIETCRGTTPPRRRGCSGRQPVHKFAMWRHSGATCVSAPRCWYFRNGYGLLPNTPQARI